MATKQNHVFGSGLSSEIASTLTEERGELVMNEGQVEFPTRSIGPFALIAQKLSTEHLADVRSETRDRLRHSGFLRHLESGQKVGITAGSRGIGGLGELLAGIVDAVKETGAEPFLLPAMGSHGGSTAAGQTEILRRFGVDEESVGAPIQATMNTRTLGRVSNGATAHLDEIAAEADGIIVMGRVKTHPENTTGVASGLLKMVTIGLGKQAGAQEAHSHGLWDSVEQVPKLTMSSTKILCGVSVVENGFRQPVAIEVVAPSYQAFLESDQRLLKKARPLVAKIPFQQLDLLIVDQLGKSISGTGMDLNVIGKWRVEGGDRNPNFRRIVVLSLTHESLGNGLGIGLADFTTKRFVAEFDPYATYINLLTATEQDSMNTMEAPLPLALDSDHKAIEVALYSALATGKPRICRIKNTACLDRMWVSEALLPEVNQNSTLEVIESPKALEFNSDGNLF